VQWTVALDVHQPGDTAREVLVDVAWHLGLRTVAPGPDGRAIVAVEAADRDAALETVRAALAFAGDAAGRFVRMLAP
jgi:hypothetical protein